MKVFILFAVFLGIGYASYRALFSKLDQATESLTELTDVESVNTDKRPTDLSENVPQREPSSEIAGDPLAPSSAQEDENAKAVNDLASSGSNPNLDETAEEDVEEDAEENESDEYGANEEIPSEEDSPALDYQPKGPATISAFGQVLAIGKNIYSGPPPPTVTSTASGGGSSSDTSSSSATTEAVPELPDLFGF